MTSDPCVSKQYPADGLWRIMWQGSVSRHGLLDTVWDLPRHLRRPKPWKHEKSQKSLLRRVSDPRPRKSQKKVRKVKKKVDFQTFSWLSDFLGTFSGSWVGGVPPNSFRETFLRLFGVFGVLVAVDGGGDRKTRFARHCSTPQRAPKLTLFHADFGKEFPSRTLWRGPSWNCPSPRSVLCPWLYRTEHFSRGRTGRQGAQKRRGRGVASRGAKRKKRTRENRSVNSVQLMVSGRCCGGALPDTVDTVKKHMADGHSMAHEIITWIIRRGIIHVIVIVTRQQNHYLSN